MTPADWHRIIAAFLIFGVLWAIGGFIAWDNQQRLEDDEERTARLAANVTATLCLQAYAPEEGDPSERGLVLRYIEDQPIPLDLFGSDVCREALQKSQRQIAGEEPE